MGDENLTWMPMEDYGNAARLARRNREIGNSHLASDPDLGGFYVHRATHTWDGQNFVPVNGGAEVTARLSHPAAHLDRIRREFGEIRCTERECQGCIRVFEHEGHRHVLSHIKIKVMAEAADADSIILPVAEGPVRCSENCECSADGLTRREVVATGEQAHLAIYRFDRERRTVTLVSCQLLSPSGSCISPKVAEAGESETPLPGGGRADG